MEPEWLDLGSSVIQFYKDNKTLADFLGIYTGAPIIIGGLTILGVKLREMYKGWDRKRLAKRPLEEILNRLFLKNRRVSIGYERDDGW